ncbi:MAG: enolase C-terminal domain-like protein [Chlamydiia bacterium]
MLSFRWTACPPAEAVLHRPGLRVALRDSGGIGQGEAWPLPGWSVESYADLERFVRQLPSLAPKSYWTATSQSSGLPTSFRWAISLALESLMERPHTAEIANFRGAGLLIDTDPLWPQRLEQWTALRLPVVKLKIGASSATDAYAMISKVLDAWPWVRLRLDTNRAWDLLTSYALANDLPRTQLDYWEEPVHPSQLEAWISHTQLPFALDESLRSPSSELPSPSLLRSAQAWILKPLLTGSIGECLMFQERARGCGCRCIWSSCWESRSTIESYRLWAPTSEVHGWGPLLYAPPFTARSGAYSTEMDPRPLVASSEEATRELPIL